MKIFLEPTFRFLLAIFCIFWCTIGFLIINILSLVWYFKLVKWNEWSNNDSVKYRSWNGGRYEEDKNIVETFKRFYSLEFFS